jgi:hypothetical protein
MRIQSRHRFLGKAHYRNTTGCGCRNKNHKIGDLLVLGLPRDTIPHALAGQRLEVGCSTPDERGSSARHWSIRNGVCIDRESRNGSYGIEWIRRVIGCGGDVSRSCCCFATLLVAVPCFVKASPCGFVVCARSFREDTQG